MRKCLFALLVLLAGCSSQSSPAEKAYLAAVKPMMTRLGDADRKEDSIYAGLDKTLETDPEKGLRDLAKMIEDSNKVRAAAVQQMKALKPPPAFADFHDVYLRFLTRTIDLTEQIRNELKKEKPSALDHLEKEATQADADAAKQIEASLLKIPAKQRQELLDILVQPS